MAAISRKKVFSIRPLTIRAACSEFGETSSAVMTGVLMTFEALIISLILYNESSQLVQVSERRIVVEMLTEVHRG